MGLLDAVRSPEDLKKMRPADMEKLCGEIREFLIDTISRTGGHLASNLGVVELTVALHAIFNAPEDKIIWDVGHQSYVHKILTGRKDLFGNLRVSNGLSGFPKGSESDYDAFNTGHASTSISAAYGYSVARDLRKQKHKVVAVIGDGSMTGGLAYEAINNAGRAKTDLLVILNDNQMSISENVGAISRYLNEIRTEPAYIYAKEDVSNFISRIPLIGVRLKNFIEWTKGGLKHMLVPGSMFEELGFNYIGPIDGHNLRQMLGVLRKAKQMSGPVLLHIYTRKGRGYEQAEEAPKHFHGVDSFHVDTGEPVMTKLRDTYSDVFGKAMARLAGSDQSLVAVSAAMTDGVGLGEMAASHPDRVFDVGIAEGHAVTFSAGMAKGGMKPVVAVYSSFLQRAYDQILHDVCLQNLHVIFAIDRAGVVGADGETHQGLYDIAFLSHIPNMTILAPSSKREMSSMLEFALAHDGPVALRYPKGSASVSQRNDRPIRLGVSELVSRGNGIAFVALGPMVDVAIEATQMLRKRGLDPAVINARFVKPLDSEMISGLEGFQSVFTLEDHCAIGGFGSLVLCALDAAGIKPKYFHAFAFPDKFVPQGSRDGIFKENGLDAQSIAKKVLEITGIAPNKTKELEAAQEGG
ncbi:MAG: 1-deoxy-D-xylulose-5-phosphate synthase [Clostridiales bacterium]|jgi:1-deoxy-D-xylulose-5-phosphate synthase|nr:1-deoxy-D-xylulose-5-phosphate synthase [Clostridiales bacterium]